MEREKEFREISSIPSSEKVPSLNHSGRPHQKQVHGVPPLCILKRQDFSNQFSNDCKNVSPVDASPLSMHHLMINQDRVE